MDMLSPRVAETVCRICERAGESQLGLSSGTTIPRTTLLRRLSGSSPFTIAELEAIAKHLNTTVGEILAEAEDLEQPA